MAGLRQYLTLVEDEETAEEAIEISDLFRAEATESSRSASEDSDSASGSSSEAWSRAGTCQHLITNSLDS